MRRQLLGAAIGAAIITATSAFVVPALAAPGAATTTTTPPRERLFVLGVDGRVNGTLTPNAPFTVELRHGTTVRARTTGTTGGDGRYSVSLGYDSGHTWGIHNGDVVRVTDASTGTTTEQARDLDASFDDVTGVLVGRTHPAATLTIDVYTNGDRATKVGATTLVAASDGSFRLDVPRTLHAPKGAGPTPWRGYQAELVVRDAGAADRAVWQTVQTPNTTLVGSRAQAGGGYFLAGTAVRVELRRGAGSVAALDLVADADGIPQGTLAAAVRPGDVLRSTYRWVDGTDRSQVLDPFALTAAVDPATGTVRGRTAAGAAVASWYYGDDGSVTRTSAVAGADGTFSTPLSDAVGDHLLVVWRVADPDRTGVGAQQVELRTPALRLDDRTDVVTGYGTPGPDTAQVRVVRAGAVVWQRTATTGPDGAFSASLGFEVRPGDTVVADGTPPLRVGELSSAGTADGIAGTGTPGRIVTATTADGQSRRTTAGADGRWSIALPVAMRTWLVLRETAPAGEGASAGSAVEHWTHPTAPRVRLTDTTGRTITAGAWDTDDDAPPSTVWFHLQGPGGDRWIERRTAPYAVDAPTAGTYAVEAYAYDARSRTDGGKPVYERTATRRVTVP